MSFGEWLFWNWICGMGNHMVHLAVERTEYNDELLLPWWLHSIIYYIFWDTTGDIGAKMTWIAQQRLGYWPKLMRGFWWAIDSCENNRISMNPKWLQASYLAHMLFPCPEKFWGGHAEVPSRLQKAWQIIDWWYILHRRRWSVGMIVVVEIQTIITTTWKCRDR